MSKRIAKLVQQIQAKSYRAKRANIPFMTIGQALDIALASPNWEKIGSGAGKYHFCRRDHSIGYTTENTFIGPSEENLSEMLFRTTGTARHSPENVAYRLRRRKNALARNKRKAAAAGKAATASNSTSTGD